MPIMTSHIWLYVSQTFVDIMIANGWSKAMDPISQKTWITQKYE